MSTITSSHSIQSEKNRVDSVEEINIGYYWVTPVHWKWVSPLHALHMLTWIHWIWAVYLVLAGPDPLRRRQVGQDASMNHLHHQFLSHQTRELFPPCSWSPFKLCLPNSKRGCHMPFNQSVFRRPLRAWLMARCWDGCSSRTFSRLCSASGPDKRRWPRLQPWICFLK